MISLILYDEIIYLFGNRYRLYNEIIYPFGKTVI